jgi:hypothetical protein
MKDKLICTAAEIAAMTGSQDKRLIELSVDL